MQVATTGAPPAPPPMTAEEALRQAKAEGLALLRSEGSNTGFKGVRFNSRRNKAKHFNSGTPKPYQAQAWRSGKTVTLGTFATAEEAALAYARSPEARAAAAAPPAPPPLTAEEALRQAETEGLTLVRSESSNSGYKCVTCYNGKSHKSSPYQAKVWRGGKEVHLGHFVTREEAALCYARNTARKPEAQAAPPEPPPPLTPEEAVRQAEAEGLTLLKSESSSTGYKGVTIDRVKKSKPYKALVQRGGKTVHLGSFATAEEAALCYARASEAQAAAPQPPPASSRKRKVKSEEQPPDVPAADVVVILEGRLVESATFES